MTHAYYGSEYTDQDIKDILNKVDFPNNIKIEYYDNYENKLRLAAYNAMKKEVGYIEFEK